MAIPMRLPGPFGPADIYFYRSNFYRTFLSAALEAGKENKQCQLLT